MTNRKSQCERPAMRSHDGSFALPHALQQQVQVLPEPTFPRDLELYSYFYYFRCFQSGYGQFSFYSGYGVIFSQDIICAYGICVIGSVSISIQSSLFPFGRFRISFPHFRLQWAALAGITFFLFYKTDPISFQLIFQHDVDPVIRQAVELLVCPVSQVFFSPDIPDIPCNDTGDPLFPAVFCKISCNLVQIVRY